MSANDKTLDFECDTTWHSTQTPANTHTYTHISHFFIYSSTKESAQAEQSRKGSRWDKPISSGHILKSGITLAVWWCSQNTLSSLQHLIKGLLIFSWWSQPSQHLAATTPLFLHHTTLSRNTQVGFKHANLPTKLPVPYEPSKKKVSFKCPCTKPKEGGIKKRVKIKGNMISMKGF